MSPSVGFVRAAACCAVLLGLQACGGGGEGGSTPPNGAPPSTSPNRAPVAEAGADRTAYKGATVSLDGTASTDADNNALAYRWQQTAGPTVALSSATSSHPAFTAPMQSARLTFQLVVSDGQADSVADTINVDVVNRAPTASIATVDPLAPNTAALLDASASSDPDGDTLTYTWQQTGGPAVTITTLPGGRITFNAPGSNTTISFTLSVSDGEASSVNVTVNITVVVSPTPPPPPPPPAPPVVSTQMTVPRRSGVPLLTNVFAQRYEWRQTAGTPVTINNAATQTASFTAPATAGELRFELRVGYTTGSAWSLPREVVVDVRNFAPWFSVAALVPSAPRTDDTLTLNAAAGDPDDDPLTVSYSWRRNGTLVAGQTGTIYPPGLTAHGDVITGRAVASDGTESVSVEVSTTIEDTPPVISGTVPTFLPFGGNLSAHLTAFDADGDPLPPFVVTHGPAGFSVNPSGLVTWTPSGVLFDRQTDFNWGIAIQGVDSSAITGTVRVSDASRLYALRRTTTPAPFSQHGVRIGDFDNNGTREMLLLGNNAIAEVRKNGTDYVTQWMYPYNTSVDADSRAAALAAGDIDGDGKAEIFFSVGGTIVRLDGVGRRESARRVTGPLYASLLKCVELELADLDRDGDLELVCLSADTLRIAVLDPATLLVSWTATLSNNNFGLGLSSLAIGNVDADAALELVVGNGQVIDGVTHTLQWDYPTGFGRQVMIGDLDGNGVGEIVALVTGADTVVRGYDAVAKSPIWEVTKSNMPSLGVPSIEAALVGDTNGDGTDELIVANGSFLNGKMNVLEYDTGTNAFNLAVQFPYLQSSTGGLALGNVDADPALEIVLGSGISNSAADVLTVLDLGVQAVEYSSQSEALVQDYGFVGGEWARLSNGQSRLMFVAPRSELGSGGGLGLRLSALDPSTGNVTLGARLGDNLSAQSAMFVNDYDGDATDEVTFCTDHAYEGYFSTYDFAAASTEWSTTPVLGETCRALARADMNGDGHEDLVAVTTNGYIIVHDVFNNAQLWKSTAIGYIVDVDVADLDHSGAPQIVVLHYGSPGAYVSVYKQSGGPTAYLLAKQTQLPAPQFGSLDLHDLLVADVSGSGSPELFALAENSILVLDAQVNYQRTIALPSGTRAQSLYVEQSAHSRKNLLLAANTSGPVFSASSELSAVDAYSGALIWRSPPLFGWIQPNGLRYVDTDGDGTLELAFGTSTSMYLTR